MSQNMLQQKFSTQNDRLWLTTSFLTKCLFSHRCSQNIFPL